MAHIQKLTPETSGKIAAGEVVERPFNVVKELIENSLDASSTRIVIEIEGGGKRSIRIDDNGTGIAACEMSLAVENYSTSKISGIEDIYRVRSLGFRGEALASICAVSRLTIRSAEGWLVRVQCGVTSRPPRQLMVRASSATVQTSNKRDASSSLLLAMEKTSNGPKKSRTSTSGKIRIPTVRRVVCVG